MAMYRHHAENPFPPTRAATKFYGRAVVSLPREIDVRALRRRLHMNQNTFAARFGFSVSALRHWERGDRTPRGPSLALLNVIWHYPGIVLRALRAPPLVRVKRPRYRWVNE